MHEAVDIVTSTTYKLLRDMLSMDETYFDLIRGGEKTTTLRYWRRPRVQPGSLELVPGLGIVRIEEVRPVALRALRLPDARADGFESLLELRRTLKRIYPRAARRGRTLYRVRFTYLSGARRSDNDPPLRPRTQ